MHDDLCVDVYRGGKGNFGGDGYGVGGMEAYVGTRTNLVLIKDDGITKAVNIETVYLPTAAGVV